jgi:FdhD protein
LYETQLQPTLLHQSTINKLLKSLAHYNQIYRAAGAVHGCALCTKDDVLKFVEDVGRHNAADTIAGKMWLERINGQDKIFYTTGRLTSEIVMKAALMEISVLVSRSGITHMGLELARQLGITMIARVKGSKFLIFNGHDHFIHDV